MSRTIYQPSYWHYLTGDFLYHVHPKLRKGMRILMAVVLGALLLAGLYALFGDLVMPQLTKRITDMFNYAG